MERVEMEEADATRVKRSSSGGSDQHKTPHRTASTRKTTSSDQLLSIHESRSPKASGKLGALRFVRSKGKTFQIPRSDVLERLRGFLPQFRDDTQRLLEDRTLGHDVMIDPVVLGDDPEDEKGDGKEDDGSEREEGEGEGEREGEREEEEEGEKVENRGSRDGPYIRMNIVAGCLDDDEEEESNSIGSPSRSLGSMDSDDDDDDGDDDHKEDQVDQHGDAERKTPGSHRRRLSGDRVQTLVSRETRTRGRDLFNLLLSSSASSDLLVPDEAFSLVDAGVSNTAIEMIAQERMEGIAGTNPKRQKLMSEQ